MFRVEAVPPDSWSPSNREARSALGDGGSVLDVGCGGGGSSISLADVAMSITGVDEQEAMLAGFSAACEAAGVAHHEVLGTWPEVAALVDPADVVVCHHVVYNVAEIEPFVTALDDHARARVVVELPDRHPMSPLTPLWQHFWNLERPTDPSADLFVDVVRALGLQPSVERIERAPRKPSMDGAEYIAFVRRRLCLGADRDAEIAAAIARLEAPHGSRPLNPIASVSWKPRRSGRPRGVSG